MLCQAANAAAQKPLGFSQPHPVTSNHILGHTWNIDFLSLPETAAGNNTCFVAINKLSKIVIMAAMRMDPSAPLDSIATAKVIFDRIYPFFSVAREFTSDSGPQFISKVWWDLYIYNLLKIDKPNHRRERDKGHITRAEGMWQSNQRQS